MFEAIELGLTLNKSDYKEKENQFRTELLMLQRELEQAKVATLIIIAGVEGSGKGVVIDNINNWLDNRSIETHAFWDETTDESQRPVFWRYWMRLPARSSIAIMFGGWYWNTIYHHASGKTSDTVLDKSCQRIKEFEHMLQLDGTEIIKLWLHLPKKDFKERIESRSNANQHLGTNINGSISKHYKSFIYAAERTIRHTDTPESPWHLIEASDSYFRDAAVAKILANRFNKRIHEHRMNDRRINPTTTITDTSEKPPASVLDTLDLSLSLSKSEYKSQLKHYQQQLGELAWQAYDAKRSTVVVFEGWDAAGKGGSMRRLTGAIDARLYRGINIAAPSDEEQAHHYLWRFWRQVPRDGYMSIYDRSWYGRVLVERIEHLAKPQEWMRAYNEINAFEEELIEHGSVVLKFWLHISPEEQLKRFEARETTPWKRHKITQDDWRNREKHNEYVQAVNDMVTRTSTGKAPWTLVAANNKYYARIEVIKTLCQRLEEALKGC